MPEAKSPRGSGVGNGGASIPPQDGNAEAQIPRRGGNTLPLFSGPSLHLLVPAIHRGHHMPLQHAT